MLRQKRFAPVCHYGAPLTHRACLSACGGRGIPPCRWRICNTVQAGGRPTPAGTEASWARPSGPHRSPENASSAGPLPESAQVVSAERVLGNRLRRQAQHWIHQTSPLHLRTPPRITTVKLPSSKCGSKWQYGKHIDSAVRTRAHDAKKARGVGQH